MAQLHRHIDFITLASVLASDCYIIILMYKEPGNLWALESSLRPSKLTEATPERVLGATEQVRDSESQEAFRTSSVIWKKQFCSCLKISLCRWVCNGGRQPLWSLEGRDGQELEKRGHFLVPKQAEVPEEETVFYPNRGVRHLECSGILSVEQGRGLMATSG